MLAFEDHERAPLVVKCLEYVSRFSAWAGEIEFVVIAPTASLELIKVVRDKAEAVRESVSFVLMSSTFGGYGSDIITGIRAASGYLFAVLSEDNILHPQTLLWQASLLGASPAPYVKLQQTLAIDLEPLVQTEELSVSMSDIAGTWVPSRSRPLFPMIRTQDVDKSKLSAVTRSSDWFVESQKAFSTTHKPETLSKTWVAGENLIECMSLWYGNNKQTREEFFGSSELQPLSRLVTEPAAIWIRQALYFYMR